MREFEFDLGIEGGLTYEKLDRLFEAGCDDATFVGADEGPGYATFHREAESFFEAVLSAVRQIESVDQLRVVSLDAGELVSMPEIATRFQRAPETIRLYVAGKRGPGSFPAPVVGLSRNTKLWEWPAVAAWGRENLHLELPEDEADLAAARTISAALRVREGERLLDAAQTRELQEVLTPKS